MRGATLQTGPRTEPSSLLTSACSFFTDIFFLVYIILSYGLYNSQSVFGPELMLAEAGFIDHTACRVI